MADTLEVANLVARFSDDGAGELAASCERVAAAFTRIGKGASAMRKGISATISAKVRKLAASFDLLRQPLMHVIGPLTKVVNVLNRVGGGAGLLRNELKTLRQELKALTQRVAAVEKANSRTARTLDAMKKAADRSQKALKRQARGISRNLQRWRELRKKVRENTKATNKHTSATNRAARATLHAGGAMSSFRTNLNRVAFSLVRVGMALSAVVTGPLVLWAKAFLKAGGDAVESRNKFGVIFAAIRNEAERTADAIAAALDLSSITAREMLSYSGDILASMGLAPSEQLALSKYIAKLAGDIASLKNIAGGAPRANEIITDAMLGRRRRLKRLGFAIYDKDLKQLAESKGLDSTNLTKAQKAYLLLEKLATMAKNSLDDYARTWSSFANQVRAFLQQLKEFNEELGGLVIDTLKLDKVMAGATKLVRFLAKQLKRIPKEVYAVLVVFAGIAATIGPVLVILSAIALAVTGIISLVMAAGSLSMLFGTVAAVIAGIAAVILSIGVYLIAAGVTLYGIFRTFRTEIGETFDYIWTFFSNLEQNIAILIEWFRSHWKNLILDLTELVARFWVSLPGNAQVFFNGLIEIAGIVIGYIARLIVNELIGALKAVFSFAMQAWDALLKGIKGGLTGGEFRDAIDALADGLMQGFTTEHLLDQLGASVRDMMNKLVNPVDFDWRTDIPPFVTAFRKGFDADKPDLDGTPDLFQTDLAPALIAGSVAAYSASVSDRRQAQLDILRAQLTLQERILEALERAGDAFENVEVQD